MHMFNRFLLVRAIRTKVMRICFIHQGADIISFKDSENLRFSGLHQNKHRDFTARKNRDACFLFCATASSG